jgi:hypothetical protein
MARTIIGQPFTFTMLFVDGSGVPFVPSNPNIEVFYFDSSGVRQSLVSVNTPMPSVPGATGRYSYTLTVPSTLTPTEQLYGIMRGTEPTSGFIALSEQEVDLYYADGGGGGDSCGFRVSFLRPSSWPPAS